MNILLLSAGRRVERVRLIKQALADLGLDGCVVAADVSANAAALQVADRVHIIPRCDNPDYPQALLNICASESISAVSSGLDPELPAVSELRQRLASAGVLAWVSSPECIKFCCDKRQTNRWLRANKFPTVRQVKLGDGRLPLPVFVKPTRGSASQGVQRVETEDELAACESLPGSWIAEEVAIGREFTIHTYVDLKGRCRIAVPCERLEVRAGEVSKGITVKHRPMMELARDISERLPGALGPLNIQCFLAGDGSIRITEINPRFGGGYPLADRAGAKFCRWMIEETLGRAVDTPFDAWQDGLTMLRFDDAVFVDSGAGTSFCGGGTRSRFSQVP